MLMYIMSKYIVISKRFHMIDRKYLQNWKGGRWGRPSNNQNFVLTQMASPTILAVRTVRPVKKPFEHNKKIHFLHNFIFGPFYLRRRTVRPFARKFSLLSLAVTSLPVITWQEDWQMSLVAWTEHQSELLQLSSSPTDNAPILIKPEINDLYQSFR